MVIGDELIHSVSVISGAGKSFGRVFSVIHIFSGTTSCVVSMEVVGIVLGGVVILLSGSSRGMSSSSILVSNDDTSNLSSTAVSIFLSNPDMIASPIRTNTIPRIRLNQPRSSATLRNRAMILRHHTAMRVSMSESQNA